MSKLCPSPSSREKANLAVGRGAVGSVAVQLSLVCVPSDIKSNPTIARETINQIVTEGLVEMEVTEDGQAPQEAVVDEYPRVPVERLLERYATEENKRNTNILTSLMNYNEKKAEPIETLPVIDGQVLDVARLFVKVTGGAFRGADGMCCARDGTVVCGPVTSSIFFLPLQSQRKPSWSCGDQFASTLTSTSGMPPTSSNLTPSGCCRTRRGCGCIRRSRRR